VGEGPEWKFMGSVWEWPYITADVNSQSSALDLLVGAARASTASG
jgi:hypothetical protein